MTRAFLLTAGVALSSCGLGVSERTYDRPMARGQAHDLQLTRIDVSFREGLEATDANLLFPPPEMLVWHGDGPGDRKDQIAALMSEAVGAGLRRQMVGDRPVTAEITVLEFHAVTPRARRLGLQLAAHGVAFDLVITDPKTGEALAWQPGFTADTPALTGEAGDAAAARGDTQRSRIIRRISRLVSAWARGAPPL